MTSLDATLSPTDDEISLPISFRLTSLKKRTTAGPWCLVIAGVSSVLLGVLVLALAVTGNFQQESSSTLSTSIRGTGVAYSDVLQLLHQQNWPSIQQALCPAGKPDPSWGPTLFALARTQLGLTTEDFAAAKQKQHTFKTPHPDLELTYRFFHGSYQNATVFINPKTNKEVAYIPIWKDANTAIRHWMADNFEPDGVLEYPSMDALFAETASTPECVVTAVRDPISHFLSAYNEVEFRRHNLKEDKVVPSYYSLPHTSAENRKGRFSRFVTDMVLEDSKGYHDSVFSHTFSQSRILVDMDRVGGHLTAYLPSLANLATKFPKFVKSTCGLKQKVTVMDEEKMHHKSSDDEEGFYQAAKDVWTNEGSVARALCALHAMDYACWTDLPAGVPKVCQEIYSSTEFVKAIVG
jgi:hypothetical protein